MNSPTPYNPTLFEDQYDLTHPAGTGGRHNLSGARNDREMAALWLATKSVRSKNTEIAYTKELQRFFVWLDFHRLSFKTLTILQAQKYLADIQEADKIPRQWMCSHLNNDDAQWHALSAKSANYTRRVLANLFNYANNSGYLHGNVMQMSAAANEVVIGMKQGSVENYLEQDTWEWLQAWLEQRIGSNKEKALLFERDKWLVTLLYHTGIRREEAARARLKDVFFESRHQIWLLRVIGKGNKLRKVTLNTACVRALEHFLACIGLTMQSDVPLIPKLRGSNREGSHVTPRFVGMTIQKIREQLQNMTTHWLRHTNATHRLAFGAALETTQTELGHASINTTRIYAADTLDRRRDAAEVLVKKSPV